MSLAKLAVAAATGAAASGPVGVEAGRLGDANVGAVITSVGAWAIAGGDRGGRSKARCIREWLNGCGRPLPARSRCCLVHAA